MIPAHAARLEHVERLIAFPILQARDSLEAHGELIVAPREGGLLPRTDPLASLKTTCYHSWEQTRDALRAFDACTRKLAVPKRLQLVARMHRRYEAEQLKRSQRILEAASKADSALVDGCRELVNWVRSTHVALDHLCPPKYRRKVYRQYMAGRAYSPVAGWYSERAERHTGDVSAELGWQDHARG